MKFELQADDKAVLEKLVKSGMTPVIISQRAQILLKKAENKSSTKVAEELNVNRHTVELWCQKYRNRTPEQTIMDILSVAEGRGRKEEITGEAKTWLISIACMKPKDLGYAAETWTTSALTKHINTAAKEAGFDRLSTITESGVYKILLISFYSSFILTIQKSSFRIRLRSDKPQYQGQPLYELLLPSLLLQVLHFSFQRQTSFSEDSIAEATQPLSC